MILRTILAQGCVLGLLLMPGCGDAGSAPEATPPPAPVSASADSRAALPPEGRYLGFSDQTFTYTGGPERGLDQGVTPEREAADALGAGANAHRITLAWWPLERRPGDIDRRYLAAVQQFAARLRAGGGRVLVTLGVPPPWAAARPGDPRSAPRDSKAAVQAFARYAALVARAFPDALAIETWNEPNTRWFWRGTWKPDAAQYVRLHRAAAAAIRAVDPDLPVLFGGVLAGASGRDVVPAGTYLRDAYRAGLRPADYSGLSLHAYPPQRGRNRGSSLKAQIAEFDAGHRDTDPDARLWVTETGVTTSGRDRVSEAEQAGALSDVLDTLFADARIQGVFVHTLYEARRFPLADRERGFGLLEAESRREGRAKPAFCLLRARARRPGPFSGC